MTDLGYSSERIIPAIMPENFEHLKEEMERFVSLVPMVQIDVMDGKFTDSKSWPYEGGLDKEFVKIINQEEGFPFWEDLDIEVDLMVTNPMKEADQWIAAGVARVIVHFESDTPENIKLTLASIKEKGIETGIAFGLETTQDVLNSFYKENQDNIDVVQFMGIEKIGFQGQPFNGGVLERIKSFKESFPQVKVSVDGSVNFDTAEKLAEAGADYLVIGSALQQTDSSLSETIEQFDSFLKY